MFFGECSFFNPPGLRISRCRGRNKANPPAAPSLPRPCPLSLYPRAISSALLLDPNLRHPSDPSTTLLLSGSIFTSLPSSLSLDLSCPPSQSVCPKNSITAADVCLDGWVGGRGGITRLSLSLSATRKTHLQQEAIYTAVSQMNTNEKNGGGR